MKIKEVYLRVTEIKNSITWHKTRMCALEKQHSQLCERMRKPLQDSPANISRRDFLAKQIVYSEQALTIKLRELKEYLNAITEL